MKQKILLMLVASVFIVGANAQKKSKPVTAYAITASEKGNSKWTEVRLIDLNSGEEIQSIYNSSDDVATFNARTGKPVVKQEIGKSSNDGRKIIMIRSKDQKALTEAELKELVGVGKISGNDNMIIRKDLKDLVEIKNNVDKRPNVNLTHPDVTPDVNVVIVRKSMRSSFNPNAPFATQSAACAYDKKHERLYYTPMGINQLRYIDLKSKPPRIYYFEDEPLGALSGPGDVSNQVTRMVIGGDGNGYALSNNAEHLIRFTTNKKAEITDLGGLTDDAANGYSVHSGSAFGGDMIADRSGNLYLITASRAVFKININSKVATFKGTIKGLPRGFTTNGAAVEKGTNVIVTSSTSTSGYYMFDLNSMQAQKVSASESVYNASDLANSNLISDKKKKDKKTEPQPQQKTEEAVAAQSPAEVSADVRENKVTVYPNPVTNNVVNLFFTDYASGRYEIQLIDLTGKILQAQIITINSKTQIQELKLSSVIAKGNYLVKIVNGAGKIVSAEKLIVQ